MDVDEDFVGRLWPNNLYTLSVGVVGRTIRSQFLFQKDYKRSLNGQLGTWQLVVFVGLKVYVNFFWHASELENIAHLFFKPSNSK